MVPTSLNSDFSPTKLLNAAQLAEVLGYTEQSVYVFATRNPEKLPPAMRLGRSLRWHPVRVQNWLDVKAGLAPSIPAPVSPAPAVPVKRKRGRPSLQSLKTAGVR